MASEFITRVERDKDEPYTVIFQTDDANKYKAIEDACRYAIGHGKTQFQEVVRCGECKYFIEPSWECRKLIDRDAYGEADARVYPDYFCADGDRRSDD